MKFSFYSIGMLWCCLYFNLLLCDIIVFCCCCFRLLVAKKMGHKLYSVKRKSNFVKGVAYSMYNIDGNYTNYQSKVNVMFDNGDTHGIYKDLLLRPNLILSLVSDSGAPMLHTAGTQNKKLFELFYDCLLHFSDEILAHSIKNDHIEQERKDIIEDKQSIEEDMDAVILEFLKASGKIVDMKNGNFDGSPLEIHVNDRIRLPHGRIGTIKYIGEVDLEEEEGEEEKNEKGSRKQEMVGIELDSPDMNGRNGRKYFETTNGKGFFLSKHFMSSEEMTAASIEEGSHCRMIKLEKVPQLNGKIVKVVTYVARKERWKVKLVDSKKDNKYFGLLARNLEPIIKWVPIAGKSKTLENKPHVGELVQTVNKEWGIVSFVGEIDGMSEIAGLELIEFSMNACDGQFKGKRYFNSEMGYGYFARLDDLIENLGDATNVAQKYQEELNLKSIKNSSGGARMNRTFEELKLEAQRKGINEMNQRLKNILENKDSITESEYNRQYKYYFKKLKRFEDGTFEFDPNLQIETETETTAIDSDDNDNDNNDDSKEDEKNVSKKKIRHVLQKYFNSNYCMKSIDTTYFWGIDTKKITPDSMQYRMIESIMKNPCFWGMPPVELIFFFYVFFTLLIRIYALFVMFW